METHCSNARRQSGPADFVFLHKTNSGRVVRYHSINKKKESEISC